MKMSKSRADFFVERRSKFFHLTDDTQKHVRKVKEFFAALELLNKKTRVREQKNLD